MCLRLCQAAVGDLFGWVKRFTSRPLAELEAEATLTEAGAGGVELVDHFNGCRESPPALCRQTLLYFGCVSSV